MQLRGRKRRFLCREITDYMLWPLRLRSFMQDVEDLPELETASWGCTYLGKWLTEDAPSLFENLPELEERSKIHEEIHKSISRLVTMKKSGHLDEAQQELQKIDPMSKRMVFLLSTLDQKIN